MNDFDDDLRRGLGAGLGAPPRTPPFEDVARRARRQTRRARILGASALTTVLLAGTAVVVLGAGDDGDNESDLITDDGRPTRATTPTTAPVPTASSTSSTDTTVGGVEPGARPEVVLVATTEGRLLLLDVGTGGVSTDLGASPPDLQPAEGSPSFIDDVALIPGGGAVYVSICCEPAAGHLQVVRPGIEQLRPYDIEQFFANGSMVRPADDADGRLAIDLYGGIVVASPVLFANEDLLNGDLAHPQGEPVEGMAWYANHRLAWTELDGDLVVADVGHDPSWVSVTDRFSPPPGLTWHQPTFRSDGSLIVVERGDDADIARVLDADTGEPITSFPYDGTVVSQGYDPSGTWLLVVYDDGRLVGLGGGETFEIATGITEADW